MNPIVEESEPELEALADARSPTRSPRTPPRSGTPSRRSSLPGRAMRRSTASTRRSSRAAEPCVRVEDDPDEGVPIVHVRPTSRPRSKESRTTGSPIRTCAGCGRSAPQAELQRFHARGGVLVAGAGPGRGVYTCRRLACFERANRAPWLQSNAAETVRVEPALARLYT